MALSIQQNTKRIRKRERMKNIQSIRRAGQSFFTSTNTPAYLSTFRHLHLQILTSKRFRERENIDVEMPRCNLFQSTEHSVDKRWTRESFSITGNIQLTAFRLFFQSQLPLPFRTDDPTGNLSVDSPANTEWNLWRLALSLVRTDYFASDQSVNKRTLFRRTEPSSHRYCWAEI